MSSRTVLLVTATASLVSSFGLGSEMRAQLTEPVRLDSGLLRGTAGEHDSGIQVFKGIPFATPPIGPLRWRPPQAVAHWEGVRTADRFAPVCQQPPRTGFAAAVGSGIRLGPSSEDCLYLNVWTLAQSSGPHQPVMVWFPGGGFATGAGADWCSMVKHLPDEASSS